MAVRILIALVWVRISMRIRIWVRIRWVWIVGVAVVRISAVIIGPIGEIAADKTVPSKVAAMEAPKSTVNEFTAKSWADKAATAEPSHAAAEATHSTVKATHSAMETTTSTLSYRGYYQQATYEEKLRESLHDTYLRSHFIVAREVRKSGMFGPRYKASEQK